MTRAAIELKYFRREDVPDIAAVHTPVEEVAKSLSTPPDEWWVKDRRLKRDGILYKRELAWTTVEGDIVSMLEQALEIQPEIDGKLGPNAIELKVVLFTGRRAHPGVSLDHRTLQLLVQLGASFDVDIY